MIMNQHHEVPTTERQMRDFFQKNNLTRKRNVSEQTVLEMISLELETSAKSFGYRQMTDYLSIKYKVNISRELVRQTLKEVDPEGVLERRNRTIRRRIYDTNGPLDVVHIDGNDKLKRFGFAIHGCMDGFSRKLLWLKVCTTNNDPLVIVNYYLQFLRRYKMVPQLLRMDKGTENIYCRDLQLFFTNSETSFLNAASTRNQRIESYWSRLKKFKLSWWIKYFDTLIREFIYTPSNNFHVEALLFCFMPVIQSELNESLKLWNSRNIRQSSRAPGGIPDILFNIPASVGFENQGLIAREIDIVAAEERFGIQYPPMCKNEDTWELLYCYTQIHGLECPRDPESALDLFTNLLQFLQNDGFNV